MSIDLHYRRTWRANAAFCFLLWPLTLDLLHLTFDTKDIVSRIARTSHGLFEEEESSLVHSCDHEVYKQNCFCFETVLDKASTQHSAPHYFCEAAPLSDRYTHKPDDSSLPLDTIENAIDTCSACEGSHPLVERIYIRRGRLLTGCSC